MADDLEAARRRSKRRGSENRQRVMSVAVRFTPDERAVLAAASRRTGKGAATLLRETFLADCASEVDEKR